MSVFLKLIFLLVNNLFVAKYTIRAGYNPIITTGVYSAIVIIIFQLKLLRISFKHSKAIILILSSLIIISIGLLHHFIDPLRIQVDRWSAINNFIDYLFNGIYPYSARTHLGGYGSPFPIWQLFHIPFFILGDIGIGMIFSFVILVVFLWWYFEAQKSTLIYLILMLISPAFWYEAAVRSDLMYNLIICLILIGIVDKLNVSLQSQPLFLGIIVGLFLSTRLSIAIPFTIYLFPGFLNATTYNKLKFLSIASMLFALTFLPFILWDFKTLFFFQYNPFILQSRQGSILEVILILGLSVSFSFLWKKDIALCFALSSVALTSLVIVTFIHRMISNHFISGIFDSAYDITYFNMALPFLIFYLTSDYSYKRE